MSTTTNRTVTNPRWRSASFTIVPEDDFDEYIPSFLQQPEEVPARLSWTRPNTANNRVVVPVLRNSGGVLLTDNRQLLEEDSYAPWR